MLLALALVALLPSFAGAQSFACPHGVVAAQAGAHAAVAHGVATCPTGQGSAPENWVNGAASVAFYSLDEAAGTRVSEGSCGTSCDLALASTPAPANDTTNFQEGTASILMSDVDNNWIGCDQLTDCTTLNDIHEFTTMAWVRPTTIGGGSRSWQRNNLGGASGGAIMDMNTAGAMRCVIFSAAGTAAVATGGTLSLNTWHHVACTYTTVGTTVATFLDSVAGGTNNTQTMAQSTADRWTVSNELGGSGDWAGQIDELWHYDAPFTSAQLCRVRACGAKGEKCWCGETPTEYRTCSTDTDCNGRVGACDGGTGRCTGRLSTGPTACNDTGELSACNAAAP